MSAIVRSWIRMFCPKCGTRSTYNLEGDWHIRCSTCGHERSLVNGLLTR